MARGLIPWPQPTPIPNTPIWGTIAVGPDGEVYLGGGTGSIRVTRSDNAQNPAQSPTCSPVVLVNMGGNTATMVTANPGGAPGQTWIDVNRSSGPRRGHVYLLTLISPAGGRPGRCPLRAQRERPAAWTSCRPHRRRRCVYFIRVNDWDCNQNGVGDTLDPGSGALHDCDNNAVPDECEIAAGAKPDKNNNGIPDGCECYADCDADGLLALADFGCFQTKFGLGCP